MTDKTGHGFRSNALALRFANAAVGMMIGGYDSSFDYQGTQQVEINGTSGRILIADTVRRFSYQTPGSEFASVWEPGQFNDHDRSFAQTLDNYMDATIKAFKQGAEPPVPARCGRRALQLALAVIQSFHCGNRNKVTDGN